MTERVQTLVDEASRGDSDAVEELLVRYLSDLHGYVGRHAGALLRGRESDSDLVQSVCREVLQRLRGEEFEYRGEPAFRQWLFQAALLKIKNRHRYHAAERRSPLGEAVLPEGSAADEFFASLCTPSAQAMAREQLERARAAFVRLTEQQREIIVLARIQGLGHADVAERLGITEPHSRVLLSRALARLATELDRS